jgi:hypothetical protein
MAGKGRLLFEIIIFSLLPWTTLFGKLAVKKSKTRLSRKTILAPKQFQHKIYANKNFKTNQIAQFVGKN